MKRYLTAIIIIVFFAYSKGQNYVRYVDLGLPSGTLWADRNVGAAEPEDNGDFFAWGETKPKKKYQWRNYKYRVSGDVKGYGKCSVIFSKYMSYEQYRNIILEPEDDAATQNLGPDWRMPTYEEMDELLKSCTWSWVSRNGVSGYDVIGPNSCKIFIPAAGCKVDAKNYTSNEAPNLWTSTLDSRVFNGWRRFDISGWTLCHTITFNRGNLGLETKARCIGCNVRGVYKEKKNQCAGKPNINFTNLPSLSHIKNIIIQAGIKSLTKISNIEFFVNGQLERGINVVNRNEYDAELKKEIELNEGENTIKLVVTNSAGSTEDIRTIIYTPTVIQKPQIMWNNFTDISKSKTYHLSISIKSPSKIEYVSVYINGQLERGIVVSQTTNGDMEIVRTVTLQEGQNIIKIEVKNKDGVSITEKTVTYTPQSFSPVTVNQKRIALVIGNSNYTNATKLPNPANDATDVASKLRSLGFEVIEKHDLTIKTFKSTIRDFGKKASSYDASVVYYAGHAIEKNGKNYLIPTNATIEVASDIEDECVRADYIIDNLEEAKSKMNIIVLDACRNNPIDRNWARSISGGLSSMIAPTGTFIAFSTAPGHTAADGDGRNSPFTEAFLNCLDKPNLQLELFFKEVLRDVSNKTSNRQIPWTQSSFIGDFYFNIK